jgi:hypothetical protein
MSSVRRWPPARVYISFGPIRACEYIRGAASWIVIFLKECVFTDDEVGTRIGSADQRANFLSFWIVTEFVSRTFEQRLRCVVV